MLTSVARPYVQLAAAAAVLFALAGCGSSSGPTIPKAKISKLVLQKADLSKQFAPFDVGPQVRADQAPVRSNASRFGREGGWIARYHRGGTPKTNGPLVIASRVDLFKDVGGAKQDFALYRSQLQGLAGAKELDVGHLGQAAVGVTTVQPGTIGVRTYAIAWRQANATAELELNGFDRRVTVHDAVALARRQAKRLRDAVR
jgi:hypothetical protein